jgi:catechol 2,3-dioxygenase-like lactoylglutathione lyase family enzyme
VIRFRKVTPRLPVADLRQAIAFYTDLLGFQLSLLWPEQSPTFAILDRDDVCVQFDAPESSPVEPVGHGTLSFDVGDVRELHASLQGRVAIEWGAEVYWYGRREFSIRDPNGYLLIFTELTDDDPTCHDEG